jgi:hypothetical protein
MLALCATTLGGQTAASQRKEGQLRWDDHGLRAGLDSAFGGWYTLCLSGESAMKIIGHGTDRLRLKLRIMSDDDLWWLFLNHREE